MKTFLPLCLLFPASVFLLLADGGNLILQKRAGPFQIAVFSSPETLRVGVADLSVLVERTADRSTSLHSDVKLRLRHTSPNGIAEVFAPATHANASNKLLYAARINLPEQGTWTLVATVDGKDGFAEVGGTVNVLPPQPPFMVYWPYFAVVPLLIVLFVWNQWLKRKRRSTSS